jgi:hypothetical protein
MSSGEIVVGGGAQEAVAVGQHFERAGAANDDAALDLASDDGHDQLAAIHAGVLHDAFFFGIGEQLGHCEAIEIVQARHRRAGRGSVNDGSGDGSRRGNHGPFGDGSGGALHRDDLADDAAADSGCGSGGGVGHIARPIVATSDGHNVPPKNQKDSGRGSERPAANLETKEHRHATTAAWLAACADPRDVTGQFGMVGRNGRGPVEPGKTDSSDEGEKSSPR